MEDLTKFLEITLLRAGKYEIRVYTLFIILVIFLITKLILWLIKKTLFRKHKKDPADIGNTYALFQIIRYTIWVIAIVVMVQSVGLKITVLLAGSAALLVGIGLGLQQTFNDILSGIILLAERSIRIGDILEIDGNVVKIESIGLRTSMGLDRDEISIIIPNSLITNNKVINWSHQSMNTRFKINLGVAYGSNIDLTLKILQESALEHPDIFDKNLVEARLIDFGNSAIEFQLLFYSQNIFRIEKVKSDIRRIINKKFQENHIIFPFPQLDVHLDPNSNNRGE
jgi:small-conductance mechanosensitive channel